jgi:hypothetical protein
MATITTKNYRMTTWEHLENKASFCVTDKAIKNKKRKINKLVWIGAYAIPSKKGNFSVKYPHYFTVLGKENIQAFINLINA